MKFSVIKIFLSHSSLVMFFWMKILGNFQILAISGSDGGNYCRILKNFQILVISRSQWREYLGYFWISMQGIYWLILGLYGEYYSWFTRRKAQRQKETEKEFWEKPEFLIAIILNQAQTFGDYGYNNNKHIHNLQTFEGYGLLVLAL